MFALRTGGLYCARIHSDRGLAWAAAGVREPWRRRGYSGPGRAGSWSRAWTDAQWALAGSRDRDPGGGHRRKAEGWTNTNKNRLIHLRV